MSASTGNTIVSSTISDFVFSSARGVSGGETISGSFEGTYSNAGVLMDASGTIILTEKNVFGGVTTETFTTSGTEGVRDDGAVPSASYDTYEVYLNETSATSTGVGAAPTFSVLHLDWTSATTQELFSGQSQGGHFSAINQGQGNNTQTLTTLGTEMTTDMPCFASGTRILTDAGQIMVEDVAVGDNLVTVRNGEPALRPVIWVGKRSLDVWRHPQPEAVLPVRIIAGAFGAGLPERDLRVSPHHALFVDGVLIEAISLINGATIIQERNTRFVTYHHVELDGHDVLLAEGLAAESFLDTGSRNAFEGEAALQLHPEFATAEGAAFCAPLVRQGEALAAVRARLLARAGELGFVRSAEVALTAKIGGTLVPAQTENGVARFDVPAGNDSMVLLSAAGVPVQMNGGEADLRRLGVAVAGIALVADGVRTPVPLNDPGHAGFHVMEDGHRWTDGAARIALPAHGAAVLEITIAGHALRWEDNMRDHRAA